MAKPENIKIEFNNKALDEKELGKNPLNALKNWMDEANEAKIPKYNAMCLSTVGPENKPSSRIVLLRQITGKGLVFYTHYQSSKGEQIKKNPFASLNIFWHELDRQVRIEGEIEKVPDAVSDEYFGQRDRESQLSAWSSQQSKAIASRNEMEKNYLLMEKKYAGKSIPRPDHWGGYQLIPESIEFWQGRFKRLHDRIKFVTNGKEWKIIRLQP